MKNGFYLVDNLDQIKVDDSFLVASIDGSDIKNMDDLYKIFNEEFVFPDYFGQNTEAFYELMNDLDWLEKNAYCIKLKNYDAMFSDDKEDKLTCLEMLYQIALEWQDVPNFDGEEEYRSPAEFRIYIEKTSSIASDLKEMEITEGVFVV